MPVPGFQDFMLPTLKIIEDNKEHKSRDVIEKVAAILGLTEEDKQEKLPSQSQAVYYNRAMWARTYLKKACLLDYPERGIIKITPRGLDLLKTNPEKITNKFLSQHYAEFKDFRRTDNFKQNETNICELSENEKTPDELIAEASTRLSTHLEEELLLKIRENSPEFFEKLVIKLLLAMGYGGTEEDILQHHGKSGDGGIDGIIKQDALGLDKVYIQAKRWDRENSVPSPEIQKFIGALHMQNANRGVFITTSDFSNGAEKCVTNSNIILINGKQLVKLMIKYNVGVQIKDTLEIKKIDEDFFTDE